MSFFLWRWHLYKTPLRYIPQKPILQNAEQKLAEEGSAFYEWSLTLERARAGIADSVDTGAHLWKMATVNEMEMDDLSLR